MREPLVTGRTPAGCRGIEHQVAGSEFDLLDTELRLDAEFAALVVFGRGQEQRGGEVAAKVWLRGVVEHGAVDVHAVVSATLIAVEPRRIDLLRQGRRYEERVSSQRRKNAVAEAPAGSQ